MKIIIRREIKTAEDAFEAVREDGCALHYVPENLRTAELCLAAVQNSYFSTLKYVPQDLRTAELCLAAVQKNGYNLPDVPEHLRSVELCLAAAECIHKMNEELEAAILAVKATYFS